MPVVSCRVAPVPRSSGCACCGGPSRLESRTLQRSRRSGPEVTPWPLILRRIRLAISRVAPFPRFFVCASDGVSGRPYLASSGFAAWRLRIAANPASTAGPMMSPATSNFASSGISQRMNLRGHRNKCFLA